MFKTSSKTWEIFCLIIEKKEFVKQKKSTDKKYTSLYNTLADLTGIAR